VGQTILFAILLALSAALLDRILDLPLFGEVRSAAGAAVGPDERRGFLRGMLALLGLPSALLVALTSFAVPTLTPYANPGLLLTHRAYHDRLGRIWVIGFLLARYNSFSLALLASVGLSATLATLVVLDTAHLITLHLITCALVALAACFTLGLMLQFVFWVLRMRQPSEVITEARRLALNALWHASHSSGLTPRRLDDDVDGPFNAKWEEQHEIKLLVDALAQVALRTRAERHPFGPHEALRALTDVVEHARQSVFPPSWGEARSQDITKTETFLVDGRPSPQWKTVGEPQWIERLTIEAIGAVLVASAESRDLVTGTAAASQLLVLSQRYVVLSPTDYGAGLELILEKFGHAIQECIHSREFALRYQLLEVLEALIGSIGRTGVPPEWPIWFWSRLRSLGSRLALAAVSVDDVVALQAILALLERSTRVLRQTCTAVTDTAVTDTAVTDTAVTGTPVGNPRAVLELIQVGLELSATALHGGASGSATFALGWSARLDRRRGVLLWLAARPSLSTSGNWPLNSPARPRHVPVESVMLAFVLVASHPTPLSWLPRVTRAAASAVSRVPGGRPSCEAALAALPRNGHTHAWRRNLACF